MWYPLYHQSQDQVKLHSNGSYNSAQEKVYSAKVADVEELAV